MGDAIETEEMQGGMREEGNRRGRNDGRGRSDGRQRCRDEGGRSGCVRFGMRVGTVGFKKNLNIYVLFQKNNNKKIKIKIKIRANRASLTLTWMGCCPIRARPIGLGSIRATNFMALPLHNIMPKWVGPSYSTHIPSSSVKS